MPVPPEEENCTVTLDGTPHSLRRSSGSCSTETQPPPAAAPEMGASRLRRTARRSAWASLAGAAVVGGRSGDAEVTGCWELLLREAVPSPEGPFLPAVACWEAPIMPMLSSAAGWEDVCGAWRPGCSGDEDDSCKIACEFTSISRVACAEPSVA